MNPEQKDKKDLITFTTQFNPRNPKIFSKIKENLFILKNDPKLASILENKKILQVSKQPKNLKRLLTNNHFGDKDKKTGAIRCGNSICGLCKNNEFLEGNSHTFNNGYTHYITTLLTCSSKNLIYVIICDNCGLEYVGETGDTLQHRTTLHRQQIKCENYRVLKVSHHIANCSKNQSKKFKIMPIFKMPTNCEIIHRRSKEHWLIKKTQPALNACDGTSLLN